jgi:hypothetical protein
VDLPRRQRLGDGVEHRRGFMTPLIAGPSRT